MVVPFAENKGKNNENEFPDALSWGTQVESLPSVAMATYAHKTKTVVAFSLRNDYLLEPCMKPSAIGRFRERLNSIHGDLQHMMFYHPSGHAFSETLNSARISLARLAVATALAAACI